MAHTGHYRVETTTDAQQSAEALADSALRARLAACVQVEGPITSYYRWEGATRHDPEWRVVFKTAGDRLDALLAHVRREHGYDVPEVIATPITHGHPEYLDWVVAETRG